MLQKKSRRSTRSSGGSATSPSTSFPSPHTSLPDLQEALSCRVYQNAQTKSSFLQHPSEEIPSATSSSMLSLWIPTTDSGISLPLVIFGILVLYFFSMTQMKVIKLMILLYIMTLLSSPSIIPFQFN